MVVENLTNENTASLTRNAPIVRIPLDTVGISLAHLVRPLDLQYVDELAETDESQWEPIEIRVWPAEWDRPTDILYHVVSGNHRTSAARKRGLLFIQARIIEAEDDKTYLYAAIRTNARHGRNFTEDDRKALAAKLKALGESSTAIAALFGVNKSTVNNWLSGRDSNANKKKAAVTQAKETLANLDTQEMSEEWRYVPTITADAKKLAKVGQTINDFLAESPVQEDKAHILAWVRSLSKETTRSLSQDMMETSSWLTQVAALLQRQGEQAS